MIVTFFLAADDKAAIDLMADDSVDEFESVSYGNFDADEAVVEWTSILTGESFADLIAADEPRILGVAEDPDGVEGSQLLFVIPAALQRALVDSDGASLVEVRDRWLAQRAEEGEEFDPELVDQLLNDLASLARMADGLGHSVYCCME
jgi:hypothetical protein